MQPLPLMGSPLRAAFCAVRVLVLSPLAGVGPDTHLEASVSSS